MKTIIRLLSLSVLLLTGLNWINAQSTDNTVYMTALRYFYDKIIEDTSSCITISYKYEAVPLVGSSIYHEVEKLDSILVENFMVNNGYCDTCMPVDVDIFTAYLHEIFDGVPNVYIISKAEAEELGRKPTKKADFWKRLFRKYSCSGGYLFLSHIGYNEDKTEAIFYIENLFHDLSGGGFLAICKFVDGKWQIEIKNVMAI